jgi:hypothetical protein
LAFAVEIDKDVARRVLSLRYRPESDSGGPSWLTMFQRAIRGHSLPKYLSSNHDPLYRFQQWEANLRILEVTEIKTVPYVPLSHRDRPGIRISPKPLHSSSRDPPDGLRRLQLS